MARKPRRPSRRRWLAVPIIPVLILLILADRQGWLLVERADDLSRYHGVRTMVTRVIDGDTIEVALADPKQNSDTTRVRLWGIDGPELATDNGAIDPIALEARDMANNLVEGRTVMLLLEPQRLRDRYGRILAHVELEDGTSVAAVLLEHGLARADDRWAHAMQMRYAQLERAAKRKRVGRWATP